MNPENEMENNGMHKLNVKENVIDSWQANPLYYETSFRVRCGRQKWGILYFFDLYYIIFYFNIDTTFFFVSVYVLNTSSCNS
ncbi:MAG: hypothetical protein K0S61_4156 [Anaerocolumna sp.]|jgi:hypothetical protein|nr:hypothetical protein [Anaerocolumna sp.]